MPNKGYRVRLLGDTTSARVNGVYGENGDMTLVAADGETNHILAALFLCRAVSVWVGRHACVTTWRHGL